MRFENRIDAVTGGSRGAVLGREINSRPPHFSLRCDISNGTDVEQAFAQVDSHFGRGQMFRNPCASATDRC